MVAGDNVDVELTGLDITTVRERNESKRILRFQTWGLRGLGGHPQK